MQNFTSTFFLVWFVFTAAGIGLIVPGKFKATCLAAGEKLFIAFCIGAGIIGYCIYVLASFQLLYSSILYGLLILLVVIACWGWYCSGITNFFRFPQKLFEQAALIALLVVLSAAFILALTPETGKDALTYHLAVPKLYLKHHGFYYIEGNVFSNLPLHTDMLFLIGLFLGGDILVKVIAFAVFPLLLLGVGQFAAHNMKSNTLSYLSVLIFATVPSVFMLATTAYIDLYVALYAMGAVSAFFRWQDRRERAWLLLFGFFTGLAVSCKYSALFFPFLGILGILWTHRESQEAGSAMRDLFIYLLVSVIWGSPFYIKNWIMTGNPLYPFMYPVFGGRGLDPEFARLFAGLYRYMGMGREWMDYILLPWNVSFLAKMNSIKFDGVIGPIFFLVLPFLIGVKNKDDRLKMILIYCGAYFLFWASSSQDIRYLTPILPFLALLVGFVLSSYQQQKNVTVLLSIIVSGCLVYNSYHIAREIIKVNPLRVVSGKEDRAAFMTRSLSHYPMYQFANRNLPEDAKVFLVYMRNLGYLLDRQYYSDSMLEDYTLRKILSASSSPEEVLQKMKKMGFTHLMYDKVFVTGGKSLLSVEDKTLFNRFEESHLKLLHSDKTYGLYELL